MLSSLRSISAASKALPLASRAGKRALGSSALSTPVHRASVACGRAPTLAALAAGMIRAQGSERAVGARAFSQGAASAGMSSSAAPYKTFAGPEDCAPWKVRAVRDAVAQGLIGEHCPIAFFWNLTDFQTQLKDATAAFPPHFVHTVASKANPLQRIIEAGAEAGGGSEAASLGELALVMDSQKDLTKIVLDSPCKTRAEIRQALEWGVGFTIDNLSELARVDAILAELNAAARTAAGTPTKPEDIPLAELTYSNAIGIRVNPQIGSGTIITHSVSKPWSKFGTPVEFHEDVVAAYALRPWLNAIHVHAGSQTYTLHQHAGAIRATTDIANRINANAKAAGREGQQVTTVDIGGGMPVNFSSEANLPPFKEYSDILKEAVPELFSGEYRVMTENGRRYLAKQGFMCSRIEYVKQAGGRRVVLQHAGADLCVRTVYKGDAWPLRVTPFRADGTPFPEPAADAAPLLPADVAGPSCIDDVLAPSQRPLPPVAEGDFIALHDTGAYYHSSWSYYNCRTTPALYCFYEPKEEGEAITFELIRPEGTVAEATGFFKTKQA